MKITVDFDLCESNAICMDIAPTVFCSWTSSLSTIEMFLIACASPLRQAK